MDCPTEETLIRKKLGGLDGVHALDFNLMQRVLTVVHADGALDRITAAIKSLGMTPEPLAENAPRPPAPAAKPVNWWAIGGAGLMAALSEFLAFRRLVRLRHRRAGRGRHPGLRPGHLPGLDRRAQRQSQHQRPDEHRRHRRGADRPMARAAMVMFLFNVAELIEARSLDRARNAIRGLLDLAPRPPRAGSPTARGKRCRPRNCSQATSCACGPANASPPTARSSAAARPWTSRPSPVKACRWKRPRATPVYAATVNASGSFEYRVTAAAGNTTLARIIHAVEQAQGARAPTQRFIDRFSRIYTPVVVGVAVLVAVVPPLLWSQPWFDAIYRALALLIIACPCALVISTPVSIVSGLTAASRRGILVRAASTSKAATCNGWRWTRPAP